MHDSYVIVEGRPNDDPLGATGTVGLIADENCMILVDAGDPWNGSEILANLERFSSPITHVIVTHGHLDHCANLGLFPEATVIMDCDIAHKSNEKLKSIEYSTVLQWPYRVSKNCEIMNLSGHTASDTIVYFNDRKIKKHVVYSGDLVEDSEDLLNFAIVQLELTRENFEEDLLLSQEYIFGTGDLIIPGHGPMFENPDRILYLFFSFWRRFMKT